MNIKQVHQLTGRAGGYAVSTVDSRAFTQAATQSPTKTKKSKSVITLTHAIFLECAKLTMDPYWVKVFTQAAYDKLPKRFSCRNNQLHFKRGQKITSIDLPAKPIPAYELCLDFFKRFGGLYSELDEAETRRQQELADELQLMPQIWTKVKKKMRTIMIENYIESLVRSHGLDHEQKDDLHQVLNLGIVFGYFNKDNIYITGRKIAHVEGLVFDADTKTFSIHPSLPPKPTKSSKPKAGKQTGEKIGDGEKDTKISLDRDWTKYILSVSPTARIFTKRKIRNRLHLLHEEQVTPQVKAKPRLNIL